MTHAVSVQPMDRADVKRSSEMLAKAFYDDPWFSWLLPDASKRARRAAWLFGMALKYGFQYGAVFTDAEKSGASIWLTPGNTTISGSGLARSGYFMMPFRMGLTAFSRFNSTGTVLDPVHKSQTPGPHWYLFMLGVDPAQQGSGKGTALIEAGTRQADEQGLPCYLETQKEANVRFYERSGFRVVATARLPMGGPMTWAMVREPRS